MDLAYAANVIKTTSGSPEDVDTILALFPSGVVCSAPAVSRPARRQCINHLVSTVGFGRIPACHSFCGAGIDTDAAPASPGRVCRQCCRCLHRIADMWVMSMQFQEYVTSGFGERQRADLADDIYLGEPKRNKRHKPPTEAESLSGFVAPGGWTVISDKPNFFMALRKLQ